MAPWAGLIVKPHLTPREARVLELIAEGLTTREMAGLLSVSPKDIEYHAGNLIMKFCVANRSGVVARAYVLGYLSRQWPPTAQKEASL